MAKTTSPSFVLSLELKATPQLLSIAMKELEICRVIYNTVLGQYLKLETQMKREKKYKKLIRQFKAVSIKLEKDPKNEFLIRDLKQIKQQLKTLREKYQLTEYASHHWVKPVRNHFGNKVNAAVAQKIASRAWHAFSRKLFGKAKNVQFIRKDDMQSFEGKSNTTGWRYMDQHIIYKDFHTPLIIKNNDEYALEVIKQLEEKTPFTYMVKSKGDMKTLTDFCRVKFVRIVKKEIRGKMRLFADLIISGYPPIKKQQKIGKGKVGLDIGTSTLAVASLTKVVFVNLAEKVKQMASEIRIMQRKMDRSRRAMNPGNYQLDGTVKKGKKTWVFSHRYQQLRTQVKDLHRKQAAVRKMSHQTLANQIVALGDTFYVEDMNFKALQERKKKTEISSKTGTYKRKKRFGKTLGNRAPGLFISILEEKVKRLGGTFSKVNTREFKASQYCHIRDDYIKKPLSERWHMIEAHTKVQRDLYAAFLLMNANKNGTKANRKTCEETFPLFKTLHDEVIQQIIEQKKMIFNSGIVVPN